MSGADLTDRDADTNGGASIAPKPSEEPDLKSDAEIAAPYADEPRFRLPWPLQLAIMLFVGLAVGAFVIHKHDTAKVPLVVVNGYVIDQKAFDDRLEAIGGAQVLRAMVSDQLKIQYAEKLGVLPSQKDLNEAYNELLATPEAPALIAANGDSVGAVKHQLLLEMVQARVAGIGVKLTDADVQAYYKANTDPKNPNAQFYTPATVTISVIKTSSQDKIEKAQQMLNQSETFDYVASQLSEDPSKKNGGQLPTIAYNRTDLKFHPAIQDAIFNLEIDQVYGPVNFDGYWWLIQCNDKTVSSVQPFNQVRRMCLEGAALQKGVPMKASKIQTDFETFQKGSTIRVLAPQYKDALNFGK
jgi:parvulin-like peptidyl-prolyl isomerase